MKKPQYFQYLDVLSVFFVLYGKKTLRFDKHLDIMSPVESFGSVVASRCQSQAKRST